MILHVCQPSRKIFGQHLRAICAHSGCTLTQVVALFPFLRFDTSSWRQWALERLAAWPRTAGAVLGAVGVLPTAVPRALLRTLACALPNPGSEGSHGTFHWK